MKRLLLSYILAAETSLGYAQLYSFPVPAMTVADCQPGQQWLRRGNGLPYCGVPQPPPDPQPQPPACQYSYNAYNISIGDMGQCSADGGCEGKGYQILWGGSVVASRMWTGHMDWSDLGPQAVAGIDASGYRVGAIKLNYPSNGNNMGLQVYEVCRK